MKPRGKVGSEEGEEAFTVFAHSPDTVEHEKLKGGRRMAQVAKNLRRTPNPHYPCERLGMTVFICNLVPQVQRKTGPHITGQLVKPNTELPVQGRTFSKTGKIIVGSD